MIKLNKNKLLTEKNLRFKDPPFSKIKLKEHQRAILYRLREIESKYSIGIMADIAGSGKSYCMLALILYEKIFAKKTQNLLIVPYNIHSQWVKYISDYTDKLNTLSFINYSDISKIYYDKRVLEKYDMLITTPIYYDAIISALNATNNTINRIIIDEIDSIEWFINKPFPSKKCWFISASFQPTKIGQYKIDHSVIPEITCKCDDLFILKGFPLPEPIHYFYKNYLEYVDVFNVFGPQQLHKIYMMDYFYEFEHVSEIALGPKHLLNLIKIDTVKSIEVLKEQVISSKRNGSTELQFVEKLDTKEKTLMLINNAVEKRFKLNVKVLKNKSKNFEDIQEYISKLDCLEKIIEILKSKTDLKLIIFSDNQTVFEEIECILNQCGLKSSQLNGGNIKNIDDSIYSYKNEDTPVLLINSMLHGSGINFENTTDIIIVHKSTTEHQVIGRAQRPGRSTALNIHHLLYENE